MKKRILGALAALMVLTVGMTAFAASPSTGSANVSAAQKEASALSTVVKANGGTMSDGTNVSVIISDVAPVYLESARAEAKALGGDNASVLAIANVVLHGADFSGGKTISIPFALDVKAGQKVTVLHHNGTAWEVIKNVKVNDGQVIAEFSSLSPVAFVIGATSAKTGADAVLPVMALICLAGVAVCGYKAKN